MYVMQRIFGKSSKGHRGVSNFFAQEYVLSQENREKTSAKFMNTKPIRLQPHKPAKKAAVLIPLCLVDNKVSLLYTLRGSKLKSHRGQVSFPGGMQDVKDRNLQETALRETYEELGIEKDDVDIWGYGNTVVARGETCVIPIIGQIKHDLDVNKLKLCQDEVHEAFTVTLEDLCKPCNLGYTQFRNSYSVPVYLGAKRRIWGLTAMITHMFLRALLPPKVYTHNIKYLPPIRINTSKKLFI